MTDEKFTLFVPADNDAAVDSYAVGYIKDKIADPGLGRINDRAVEILLLGAVTDQRQRRGSAYAVGKAPGNKTGAVQPVRDYTAVCKHCRNTQRSSQPTVSDLPPM